MNETGNGAPVVYPPNWEFMNEVFQGRGGLAGMDLGESTKSSGTTNSNDDGENSNDDDDDDENANEEDATSYEDETKGDNGGSRTGPDALDQDEKSSGEEQNGRVSRCSSVADSSGSSKRRKKDIADVMGDVALAMKDAFTS
jgi:hypothetical protein